MTQLQKIQQQLASMAWQDQGDSVILKRIKWRELCEMIEANPDPPEPTPNPPIGLRPRWIVAQDRAGEIVDAMHRYACEGTSRPIPAEWIAELAELSAYLRNRKEEA